MQLIGPQYQLPNGTLRVLIRRSFAIIAGIVGLGNGSAALFSWLAKHAIFVVVRQFTFPISTEWAAAFAVAYVFFALEDLISVSDTGLVSAIKLARVSADLEDMARRIKLGVALPSSGHAGAQDNRTFARQEDAYIYLQQTILGKGVARATLLQYSCHSSDSLLHSILHEASGVDKSEVKVFIQHESIIRRLGSKEQADRITVTYKTLQGTLTDAERKNKLKVKKYKVPGSVSAVYIEMKDQSAVIMMGWYTYEYVYSESDSNKYMSVAANQNAHHRKDRIQLSGHDRAAIVMWNTAPGYSALYDTFKAIVDNYDSKSESVNI